MEQTREEIEAENRLAIEEHKEKIQQLVSDFKHSFESGPGMRTLKHLSWFCLEKESTFVEGSEMKSAFNEGARSVILEIRRWLDYDFTKNEPSGGFEDRV